jgi:AraC family transcriptional regulator, transcriptional activator of pobA
MVQTVDSIPIYALYGEPVQEAELRFIHVETIAARGSLHNWTIQPHRHDDLQQLLLVLGGGGIFQADGAQLPFSAPAFIAVPPMVVHGFAFAPGTQGFVVTMAEGFFGEILRQLDEADAAAAFETPLRLDLESTELGEHRLEEGFRAIEREFRWSAAGRTGAIAAHIALIAVALLRLMRTRHAATAPASAQVAMLGRFRHLIEAHFGEHWSVGDYARALGVTDGRLNALCRSVSSQSALETIHARLLLEAKRNLIYTSMSVSEVGYALGFQDPAYFSRFFARRAGLSPLAFRTRHATERRARMTS